VDAWEIGNEPDISFLEENPETYAAYLKVCRLGLRAGERDAALANERPGPARARVLMAPLALPPGPYFERMWANGAGAATDGFNFHYYGYAEDFSGVYVQFRDAVESAGGRKAESPATRRELPVYLSEFGYGLMDGDAAGTKDGRLRQWRWFEAVGLQMRELAPEGGMAFVLMPYLEQGKSEFGLLLTEEDSADPVAQRWKPEDFGLTETPVWMEPIGRDTPAALRGMQVSPALAWLAAAPGFEAKNWRIEDGAIPSVVVLDFVARDGLEQRKSFLGYFARGISRGGKSTGWSEVILYNFSDEPVTGSLILGMGLTSVDSTARIQLAPGERRSVPVRVEVDAGAFRGTASETTFSYEDARVESTVTTQLVTTLWPDPTLMSVEVVSDFSHEEASAAAVAGRLLGRWRAGEEPALQREGRWLISKGVTVVKGAGRTWTFRVDALPEEPARPAMVELPLPEDFVFAPGMLMEFSHRLAEGSVESEAWFDVYFRTENGNLYQVWPRSRAGREWHGYAEAAENFTMAFYGRAALPWRFAENKPVALVFFLRPERLPTIFEIQDPAITRRVAERGAE
jgi:hypothetical protein